MSRKAAVKDRLKKVLMSELDRQAFEKITVMDLCRETGISRVTFYTWYDDKYDLLEDYFSDLKKMAFEKFDELQKTRNTDNSLKQGAANMLDCIFDLSKDHIDFFNRINSEGDAELFLRFSRQVLKYVEIFILDYVKELKLKFSAEATTSFLCSGLWDFIRTECQEGKSLEDVRNDSQKLLEMTLDSGLLG